MMAMTTSNSISVKPDFFSLVAQSRSVQNACRPEQATLPDEITIPTGHSLEKTLAADPLVCGLPRARGHFLANTGEKMSSKDKIAPLAGGSFLLSFGDPVQRGARLNGEQ